PAAGRLAAAGVRSGTVGDPEPSAAAADAAAISGVATRCSTGAGDGSPGGLGAALLVAGLGAALIAPGLPETGALRLDDCAATARDGAGRATLSGPSANTGPTPTVRNPSPIKAPSSASAGKRAAFMRHSYQKFAPPRKSGRRWTMDARWWRLPTV